MHRSYRRVVTGHDKNGAAIITSYQVATQTLERPNRPGVRLTNFWITDQTPSEYNGTTDTVLGPLTIKQQLDRIVQEVSDLNKAVFNKSFDSNDLNLKNNQDDTERFTSVSYTHLTLPTKA